MERKSRVFKAYLVQLGLQNIDYTGDAAHKFSVWLVRKMSEKELDAIDGYETNFPAIKEDGMLYLTDLHHNKMTTVNDVTKAASEVTYEKLKNIPASAYLFSINDCPPDSYIQKDYNYVAYDYKVDELNYYNFKAQQDNFSGDDAIEDDYETETMKEMGTYVAPEPTDETDEGFMLAFDPNEASEEDIKRAQKILCIDESGEWSDNAQASLNVYINRISDKTSYMLREDYDVGAYYTPPDSDRTVPVLDHNFYANYWEENYGFFSAYDTDEYSMYSIPENYLEESEIQATWDDIENKKIESGPAVFGAVMVVYNNFIPVSYTELPFVIKAKSCKVSIQWSANGIIRGN